MAKPHQINGTRPLSVHAREFRIVVRQLLYQAGEFAGTGLRPVRALLNLVGDGIPAAGQSLSPGERILLDHRKGWLDAGRVPGRRLLETAVADPRVPCIVLPHVLPRRCSPAESVELREHRVADFRAFCYVGRAGFEPATYGL
jgi:hypothetical protein